MIVPGSPNALLLAGQSDPLDDLGTIERSLRTRASVSAYLSRAPNVAGNSTAWTWSGWAKLGSLNAIRTLFGAGNGAVNQNARYTQVQINSSAQIEFLEFWGDVVGGPSGGVVGRKVSTAVFRDPSAWFHIVATYDSNNSTAGDRLRIYVHGVEVLQYSTSTNLPLSFPSAVNQLAPLHTIGALSYSGVSNLTDGYLANVAFVDGLVLGPESFAQTHPRTGQWRPKSKAAIKSVVDAGGANSFFLPFDDPSSTATLCADASSKGNNWTPNNISLTTGATFDSMLDTPTNNFCTLNPLVAYNTAGSSTSDGNLKACTGGSGRKTKPATMGMSSGKWYWEVKPATPYGTAGNADAVIGIIESAAIGYSDASLQTSGYSYLYTGNKYALGSMSAYGASYDLNDVIGCALDMDAGTLEFFKNGVSQGVAFSGLSGLFFAIAGDGSSSTGTTYTFDFGQQGFAYNPPAGYKALCSKNLPIVPQGGIINPSNAFVAVTDSGGNIVATLASARAGWSNHIDIIKRRDAAEGWRWIFSDDPDYYLDSSSAAAKATVPAFGGTSYVGYSLKVSAQNGVSTGRLMHVNGVPDVVTDGLSNNRKMVILVGEAGTNWYVYHPDLSAGKLLLLNGTAAESTDGRLGSVTASGFTVGSTLPTGTYRWIALAELDGAIRLGKYAGNGSTDGSFENIGMTELLAWHRCINGVTPNYVFDSARNPDNPASLELSFSSTSAEVSITTFDLTSSGFKCRSTTEANTTSFNYVYLAIAAFPFRYANAR